jgi:hypothetical protein
MRRTGSLAEQAGFEPSVFLAKKSASVAERESQRVKRGPRKALFLSGGTDGSNPVPSSGESAANLLDTSAEGHPAKTATG